MKTAARFRVVLVTAPDLKTARRLAGAALRRHLAACANLIPGLESHYWWRGKIESSREVLLLFKTRASRLRKLERLILAEHPYDTPEFVTFPLTAGSKRYLAWLERATEQGTKE
jgi:periplasmic divalent cation tolerance protein